MFFDIAAETTLKTLDLLISDVSLQSSNLNKISLAEDNKPLVIKALLSSPDFTTIMDQALNSPKIEQRTKDNIVFIMSIFGDSKEILLGVIADAIKKNEAECPDAKTLDKVEADRYTVLIRERISAKNN